MALEQIISIAELIAIITFIILSFVAVGVLSKFKSFLTSGEESLNKVEKEINNLVDKSNELSGQFKETKEKIDIVIDKAIVIEEETLLRIQEFKATNESVNKLLFDARDTANTFNKTGEIVNEKIESISNTIEPFQKLADDAYNKIYAPVNDVSKFFKAINKGFNVFKNKVSTK
jgi:uncharacterized protein YoxC